MFKKMLVSMVVMTFLIVGGMLYYLQQTVGWTLGAEEGSTPEPERSFADETYEYFISDSEIREAINMGTTSVELIENYLLETKHDTTDGNDVAFAYVETPFLTVVKESRKIFDHYGRRPVPEEMKENLMDQFLPVHIRFYRNAAYIYEIELIQSDHSVNPYTIKTSEGGSAKTVYLKVDDLDFSTPLTVMLEDQVNKSVFLQLQLDFEEYTR